MKKIIYRAGKLLCGGIVLLLMNSCINDLLDTAPYEQLGSGNMWTTDYLTDLGMAGAYSPLRLGFKTSGSNSNRALYQMDRFGLSTMSRDIISYENATITSGDGLFSETWKYMYTGIWRCNDVIHNMPGVSPSSEEKKARYIAEAKFLRAYYYFRLNQVFKGVPVYLEEVPLEEMVRPRETEAKVWEVIIDELTQVIAEPNLPNIYAAGSSNYGHVTKGAAYALRGKTYLYKGEYDKAAQDFEQVGNCGYSLYTGNYKDLFLAQNEQSAEMIFSIQNTAAVNYGMDTQFYCGGRSAQGSNWNVYMVHPDMVDLYENADGSPFNWDDYIPGYNALPVDVREVYFLRNTEGIEEAFGGSEAEVIRGLVEDRLKTLEENYPGSNVRSLYLPGGNEQRLLTAFNNRDPRLAANVITPYSTFLGALGGAESLTTMRWPYRTENSPTRDFRTDSPNFLYYSHRKFVKEGYDEGFDRVMVPIDFPIIRYADVLLMWAEALAEQNSGVSAEAISLVNQVRERAGVGLLNSSPATTVTDKADLIERIRNERRCEFVNEGINYFDELRWKTLQEKVYYPGNGMKHAWGTVTGAWTWLDDRLYNWAIPLNEIRQNPNLEQNPGWGS